MFKFPFFNKKSKSKKTMDEKLNAIRAGVLGSNDGILTVVGVQFSVAASTHGDQFAIFIAGLADLFACALAMASGEFASVSSQSDTEKVVELQEKMNLKHDFNHSLQEVTDFYIERGVSKDTAAEIAQELMEKAPLETVLKTKHDLQLGHYVNPWEAAFSSLFAAALGGAFPLFALVLAPIAYQYSVIILATTVAVALTGYASAKLSNGFVRKAIIRNIVIGLLTIAIHYGIGMIF